jgi:Protein of unknown function (DUF1488)
MAIQFLNQSRSYDPEQRRIRFWGHDETVEVAFFLHETAIFKLAPRTQNVEAGILSAFDAALDSIHAVAAKVYAHAKGRSFYVLAPADFAA